MGIIQEARALDEPAHEAVVPAVPESEPARVIHGKRSKTENMARVTKRQLQVWTAPVEAELLEGRPRTRGECLDGPRPCPYVACKHHLYLDVTAAGSITFNFPDKEPDELVESCSLDIADSGATTLEEVGELFQLTRERIRQIEHKTLHRLKKNRAARAVMEAGGFDDVQYSPLANAQEESETLRGGTHTESEPKTAEDEVNEEYCERIDRIYERTSRERAMGVRPVYAPPPRAEEPSPEPEPAVFLAPEPEEKAVPHIEEPEAPPPAAEEETMSSERPVKVYELTERETAVVAAYRRIATKLGGKPSPLAIARRIGLEGENSNISASVCTALAAARRKGVELPYIDDKPMKKLKRVKPVHQTESQNPAAPAESAACIPADAADVAAPAPDAMKSLLLLEKDRLQKKLAAIDVLLTA